MLRISLFPLWPFSFCPQADHVKEARIISLVLQMRNEAQRVSSRAGSQPGLPPTDSLYLGGPGSSISESCSSWCQCVVGTEIHAFHHFCRLKSRVPLVPNQKEVFPIVGGCGNTFSQTCSFIPLTHLPGTGQRELSKCQKLRCSLVGRNEFS